MSATDTAYLLLTVDFAAIWACFVLLLAAVLRRRAALATPAPDAAAAVTSAWGPGWNAPTALTPTVAATDPWADFAATAPPTATALPAVQPVEQPDWNGPTALMPRGEGRRRITRPRNDLPAAAEPRWVELILTRR